jgi:hypothetical protein
MNYFTPDLLARFGSEDDRVALAAQEELEQRAERYAQYRRSIAAKLPKRFRELQQRFYLHDARVLFPGLLQPLLYPEPVWGPGGMRLFAASLSPEVESRGWPFFWIALQLDTPPKEFLVLHYRQVLIEEVFRLQHPREEGGPFVEWQYDEVELIPSDPDFGVCHSILLTSGLELRLRFRDFDFATLKPLAGSSKRKKASSRR